MDFWVGGGIEHLTVLITFEKYTFENSLLGAIKPRAASVDT